MQHRIIFLLLSWLSFFLFSCNEGEKKNPTLSPADVKVRLEQINRDLIEEDRRLVEAYIAQHQLTGIKQNGAGLYYLIKGEPVGQKIQPDNIVEFNYKLSLLDGTICYKSEPGNPKRFKVGHGGVESGLEQAVLLMSNGQRGTFILPPHLAYGLIGDNNMIPPRAVIVYEIEMLEVYR